MCSASEKKYLPIRRLEKDQEQECSNLDECSFTQLVTQLVSPFKIIVIGSPLSGKTTLHRFMEEHSILNIYELDLELSQLAGGVFPKNKHLREGTLLYEACERVFSRKGYIFMTSFVDLHLLRSLRKEGVTIIQLELSVAELLKRNKQRVENEGYEDASSFVHENVIFQNSLSRMNLVDYKIDAKKPVLQIASNIIQIALNVHKAVQWKS